MQVYAWSAAHRLSSPHVRSNVPKKEKNVTTDVFGETLGRIHMEREDFSKLHLSATLGLGKKRNREENGDDEEAGAAEEGGSGDDDAGGDDAPPPAPSAAKKEPRRKGFRAWEAPPVPGAAAAAAPSKRVKFSTKSQ